MLLLFPCRRINTFGKKVKIGVDERGEPIFHPIHEYINTLKEMYIDFLDSSEHDNLLRITGRESIGFTTFKEGALSCKCIQAPVMRVCVDEVETGFSEMVYALKKLKRRSHVQCNCAFCEGEAIKEEAEGNGK